MIIQYYNQELIKLIGGDFYRKIVRDLRKVLDFKEGTYTLETIEYDVVEIKTIGRLTGFTMAVEIYSGYDSYLAWGIVVLDGKKEASEEDVKRFNYLVDMGA